MANKICPSCGTEQDIKYKFCKDCGNPLPDENKENNFQNNTNNSKDSIFEDFINDEEKEYSEAFIDDDVDMRNFRTKANCPKCGEKIGNENYCTHCGTKVNSRVKRCLNCGSMISSMATVCPKCGYNIIQKIPVLAAALSFIFPGLGQYYNGQKQKGIILMACIIISLILTIIIIGTITGLIIWLYAIYDGFMTAKAIDRGEKVEDKLF